MGEEEGGYRQTFPSDTLKGSGSSPTPVSLHLPIYLFTRYLGVLDKLLVKFWRLAKPE